MQSVEEIKSAHDNLLNAIKKIEDAFADDDMPIGVPGPMSALCAKSWALKADPEECQRFETLLANTDELLDDLTRIDEEEAKAKPAHARFLVWAKPARAPVLEAPHGRLTRQTERSSSPDRERGSDPGRPQSAGDLDHHRDRVESTPDEHGRGILLRHFQDGTGFDPDKVGPGFSAFMRACERNKGKEFPAQFHRMLLATVAEVMAPILAAEQAKWEAREAALKAELKAAMDARDAALLSAQEARMEGFMAKVRAAFAALKGQVKSTPNPAHAPVSKR